MKTNGVIKGVGPDAPIHVHPNGAMESEMHYDFHLVDARAMFVLAQVMHHGAVRYCRDNWRGITVEDHLNHLLQHVFAYFAGDTQDDHLGHALARAMMAVAVDISDREKVSKDDDDSDGAAEGSSGCTATGKHVCSEAIQPYKMDGTLWHSTQSK